MKSGSTKCTFLAFALIMLSQLGILGCRSKKSSHKEPPVNRHKAEWMLADASVKNRWATKLSRKLRNGLEPTPAEIETWKSLSPAEIFDQIVKSPAYERGALDFTLFYLGFKDDKLVFSDGGTSTLSAYYDSALNRNVVSFGSAIDGAKALVKGEYFIGTLATLSSPLYLVLVRHSIKIHRVFLDKFLGHTPLAT